MKVKIKLSTGQEKVLDLDPRSTLGELLDRLRESDLLLGIPPKSLLASHPRNTPISATPIRSGEMLIATKSSQSTEQTAEKDITKASSSTKAASSHEMKKKEIIVIDGDETDEDVTPIKNPSAKRTLKNVRENLPRLESEQKRSRMTLKTTAPLFYQNPVLELGIPESEESCTIFLGSLVPEEHLEEAYILNYCVDLDLLIKPMFPQLRKVPVAFCISPGGVTQEMFEDCFPAVGSRLIFPKCPPYGTHHSKLLVLFYGDRGIRVIVHTSNMEITNMFMQTEGTWFQDFPLKKDSESASSPSRENDFGEYLGRVLIASGIPEANKTLARYDFSGAEVALVASFPRPIAYTSPSEIALTGMGRVIHLLEKEKRKNPAWAAKIKDWPVVLQGSSLGSQASKVAPAGNWLVDELAKSMGAKDASKVELVVATMKEMLDSQFGPDGSKSTFFNKAHFQSDVVRRMLRTWTPSNPKLPTRALLLPHFKSYLCYEPTKGREIGWAIIGSHNCTKAAWGSWTSSLKNKFTCISYELSVMFLPSIMRTAGTKRWSVERADYYDVPLRDAFVSDPDNARDNEAWLPIPYNLPTHPYDFRQNVPFTRD